MKKIKLGIVTIVKVNNYGAELQAFALQKKLELLGYSSEIIDYLFYKNKGHIPTLGSKAWGNIGWKRKLKEWLYPKTSYINSLSFQSKKKIREDKFADFHRVNTRFSKKIFNRIDDLYKNNIDYDIYMVGSDQVWNPYSNTSLDPYFLDFAPKNKKRISYASSFGVAELPENLIQKYREKINQLDYISVREQQGAKIVKNISNRHAVVVLDPTLLLSKSEWEEVAINPSIGKPYILLYILSKSEYSTKLAEWFSLSTGLSVIRLCKEAVVEDKKSKFNNIIDAGPAEFIGLFLNASFIITNSFHGTAFSVNFEKPFFTVLPSNKDNNSRQISFLSMLNLESRIVIEGSPLDSVIDNIIDYNAIRCKLEEKKNESIDFLISAIKGNNNL